MFSSIFFITELHNFSAIFSLVPGAIGAIFGDADLLDKSPTEADNFDSDSGFRELNVKKEVLIPFSSSFFLCFLEGRVSYCSC